MIFSKDVVPLIAVTTNSNQYEIKYKAYENFSYLLYHRTEEFKKKSIFRTKTIHDSVTENIS